MQFSIIIPTLNEAAVIHTSLEQLQVFRQQSCELIVVDGGSTDHTVSLAEPLADRLISSERGRACQMNRGAKIATGNILIFLHADTVLPDHALNLISAKLQGVYQWGRFDIVLSGRHFMLKVIAFMMNWRSRITGIATGDQAIFVYRDVFERIGGYSNISLMEDIALTKILNQISPPCCLSAKVISSGRRWEKFGVSKTILLMWSLRLRYFFGANPEQLADLYHRGKFWKI